MNQSQELMEVLNVKSTVQKMIKEQGGIGEFIGQVLLPVTNEMNERNFPSKMITQFQKQLGEMRRPISDYEDRQ